ncbi:MAG: PEP-CTERM sorting domain-containing protein [Burkholderiales bacterium]|nr:PEP-CTERM sorting domain-containing protein [Opitutaceae bacterium]
MNSPRLRLLAALAAVSLVSAASAQSVIYREVFGRTAGTGNASLSTYNWLGYSGATAVNESASFGNFGIAPEGTAGSGSFSNVNSLAAVNSGAVTPVDNGRTFFFGSGIFLAYTTEYTVNRSTNSITTITWDQRNDGPALSAAVQIGGNWYASSTVPGGGGGTAWSVASLNFQTTSWTAVNFTAGSTLSIGATTVLPAGDITGFGIFGPTARGTTGARLDGYTINATAIPEPSTYAALVGAAVLGLAACRRRARS